MLPFFSSFSTIVSISADGALIPSVSLGAEWVQGPFSFLPSFLQPSSILTSFPPLYPGTMILSTIYSLSTIFPLTNSYRRSLDRALELWGPDPAEHEHDLDRDPNQVRLPPPPRPVRTLAQKLEALDIVNKEVAWPLASRALVQLVAPLVGVLAWWYLAGYRPARLGGEEGLFVELVKEVYRTVMLLIAGAVAFTWGRKYARKWVGTLREKEYRTSCFAVSFLVGWES